MSPVVGDRKLLDDEKETEDVYEDAMETTVDESKQAATTAVEEKTTSANAEVPGSKAEEANTKDGWQEVRARERRVPTPPSPPLEQEPMKYVEVHLQMEGPLANRAAVVRKLGGPANVRWCAVRGSVVCPSSRSFGMRLLMTEPVCIALRAQKENSWVIDAMTMTDEDGVVLTTRYRLDPCGQEPTSWGARGAPAAPKERTYGDAHRGEANRKADVQAAWKRHFPSLPTKQTEQQPEKWQELLARMTKMEDKMEQFVAQGQTAAPPPAPAAATPAREEGSGQSFEKRVVELEATVEALKNTNKELQQRYSDAFYKEKQFERETLKLKQKIEEMQNQRWSVPPSTSPFNTPVQVPAWIPVSPLVVGDFSAGSFVFGGPGAGVGATT